MTDIVDSIVPIAETALVLGFAGKMLEGSERRTSRRPRRYSEVRRKKSKKRTSRRSYF